ncbi:MAG: putative peptidoglycan-binding domain protein [Streblomastix strix]|uniref:Putative peptidoglycan-binding domain protein n=1 Tax=Streblomastix strix TaxID=222440 RepID=A0A5J4W6A2_9EUKA|nr:MAG: putative peptidoglycan-binding domain protein [Streblomastix strix]
MIHGIQTLIGYGHKAKNIKDYYESGEAVVNAEPGWKRVYVIFKEIVTIVAGFAGAYVGTPFGGPAGAIAGDFIACKTMERVFDAAEQSVDKIGQYIKNHSGGQPGGISLDGNIQIDMLSRMMFDLPSIDSVYMDKTGKLVLISNNNQESKVAGLEHITSEDFLVALAIALQGRSISFSLDPWDPQQPDGPYYQKVFYPDILRGTAFGKTLFNTDYDMKKLAFGLMQVPGLTSELSFRLNGQSTEPSRHRLWIVSDDIQLRVSKNDNGQIIEFGPVNMRVCCKALQVDPNSRSGLRDVEAADNEQDSSHIFSKHMTEKYNLIAQKHPEYARLQNLAKLFALAKWLVQQGLEIDPEMIVFALHQKGVKIPNNLDPFDSLGTLDKVMNEDLAKSDPLRKPVQRLTNSISKTTTVQINPHQTYTQTHSWTLTGGIDLEIIIKIIKQTQPLIPLPPDLFKFITDAPPNQCIKVPGKNPAVVIPLNVLKQDQLVDEISQQPFKPKIRDNWVGKFDIFVPEDWKQLEVAGIDPNISKIYISQLSNQQAKNQLTQTMIISKLEEGPDFSLFISVIHSNKEDNGLLQQIYTQYFPGIFSALDKPQIVNARYATLPSIGTFVMTKFYGSIYGLQMAYYHCFIIPDPTLGLGKKCLFMVLSCPKVLENLMDQRSNELWNLIIDNSQKIQFHSSLHKQVQYQIHQDVELQKALAESLLTAQKQNVDKDFDRAIAESIAQSQNKTVDKNQCDITKAIKLSIRDKDKMLSTQQLNEDIELAKALEASVADSKDQQSQKSLEQDEDDFQKAIRRSLEDNKLQSRRKNELQKQEDDFERAVRLSLEEEANQKLKYDQNHNNDDVDLDEQLQIALLQSISSNQKQ